MKTWLRIIVPPWIIWALGYWASGGRRDTLTAEVSFVIGFLWGAFGALGALWKWAWRRSSQSRPGGRPAMYQ